MALRVDTGREANRGRGDEGKSSATEEEVKVRLAVVLRPDEVPARASGWEWRGLNKATLELAVMADRDVKWHSLPAVFAQRHVSACWYLILNTTFKDDAIVYIKLVAASATNRRAQGDGSRGPIKVVAE